MRNIALREVAVLMFVSAQTSFIFAAPRNIEPTDGGGPLSGASIIIGIIGAIFGAGASLKGGGGLGDAAQLAFWCFCAGAVIGLPVAWLLS